MKNIIYPIIFLLLTSCATSNNQLASLNKAQLQQSFVFSPEKPNPGDVVTIQYNPKGTPIENSEQFELIAYLIETQDSKVKATEVQLSKKGGSYTGQVNTSLETKALIISVEDIENERYDHNNGYPYSLKFYQKETNLPVEFAAASLAYLYEGSLRIRTFSELSEKKVRNNKQILSLFKEEIRNYPKAINQPRLANAFIKTAEILNEASLVEQLTKDIKPVADNLSASNKLEDLSSAASLYKSIGATTLFEKTRSKLDTKGSSFRTEVGSLSKDLSKANSLEEKTAIYKKIEQLYSKNNQPTSDRWTWEMANYCIKHNHIDDFNRYAEKLGKFMTSMILNRAASEMSGASIEEEASNINQAYQLSKQSLELLDFLIESPEEGKADYTTINQRKRELKWMYRGVLDTHALILFKQGKKEQALESQTRALENTDDNRLRNERYVTYYEAIHGEAATVKVLDKFYRNNAATSSMKQKFVQLLKKYPIDNQDTEQYIASLDAKLKEKYKAKLREEMLNESPIPFTLKNMEGEIVSSESLKGKVVILDFWATWCAPCKASFPGMQKAVNKYKDSDEVVFLFVDTFQGGDPEENLESVKEYIDSEGYTFNVLMDDEDEVSGLYGVAGIPTKSILNKNGRIVFQKSGFNSGDGEDGLVEEIDMIIELALETTK